MMLHARAEEGVNFALRRGRAFLYGEVYVYKVVVQAHKFRAMGQLLI